MGSRRLFRVLLALAAVAAVAVSVLAYATHALRRQELSTVDTRFTIRGDQPVPSDIVFVAIDDRTFAQLEQQWPFPRSLHARVIDRLRTAGAKVIAYDVQFTEPSADPRQDDALIRATRRAGNVVLATTQVAPDGTTSIFGGGAGLRYSRATAADSLFPNDPGGVVRRMDGEISGLISFPLAAASAAAGRAIRLPGSDDSAWIDFPGGADRIRSVSFVDVLRGRVPAARLRGKTVVVGSSVPVLQDLHPTSTADGDHPMPGPEIQAAAIDTALRGFPLRSGPGWLDVLLIVVLGLVAPLAAMRLRPLLAIPIALAAGAAFVVGAQLAFDGGTIVAVVCPLLAWAIGLAATVVTWGVTSAFEREQVRQVFARFVPESVVGQVLSEANGTRLGGTRLESTVMFSDLRAFTSFSERREPDLVIAVLNRYLTEMSDAILDEGGTLITYMGDGIMAVFGAPLEQADHRDRALRAARDMLRRLAAFNAWMREQGHGDGFKMGIGLNSGSVMSGNVGSERRLEYTAIGDTTNTAARIEGMTKGTPHQLLVADSTYRGLAEPPADMVAVGEMEIRGRESGIELWGLVEAAGPSEPSEPDAPVATARTSAR